MLHESKLDFWFRNGLNVLFAGRHGVGKTALVKDCFARNGLVLGETFLYFSASTLDPWVDLVGVPRERTDDGTAYLDLVRPRPLASGRVEAMFFDEFNRGHRKTRNAVMELLQFKSINGRPFPNLRVVWAAVNPEEDGPYDVEPLDPAHLDRFHVQVRLPCKPSAAWFAREFGEHAAKAALAWWEELPQAEKDRVSPRRLEYALRVYRVGGDVRDVLPVGSNVTKLLQVLRSGTPGERLAELLAARDAAAATAFLADENNLAGGLRFILNSEEAMDFFLPLLCRERLAALMSGERQVCHFVCTRHAHHPAFQKVVQDILSANQNRQLVKRMRLDLQDAQPAKTSRPAPAHFVATPASPRPWRQLVAELAGSDLGTAEGRVRAYREAVNNLPERLAAEDALATLCLFDELARRAPLAGMKLLVNMANHCIGRLAAAERIGWQEIHERHGGRFRHLLERLRSDGLAGKLFTPPADG